MRTNRLLLAIAMLLPAAPALAQPEFESRFEVAYTYAGEAFRYAETTVPLLPDNVCYEWSIRLPEGAPAPRAITERLVLPVPLADWGSVMDDTTDGVEVEPGGASAISTIPTETDAEGWITSGWCAVAGDPLGPHSIEVKVDDVLLTVYEFEVVAPEDYNWPAIRQPDPNERSVADSW